MKILMLCLTAGIFGILICAGASPATQFDTLKCQNGIASVGDRIPEVLQKCGPPTMQQKREETRGDRRAYSMVAVDEWTYNFGPNEFMYELYFENGKLRKIESLNYGY